MVPEWPGGEGWGRVHGPDPEWRLDLPDPGDAGDGSSEWRGLHLPGGASQPEQPCHSGVEGTVHICTEQDAQWNRGLRAGSALLRAGAVHLLQEPERTVWASSDRQHLSVFPQRQICFPYNVGLGLMGEEENNAVGKGVCDTLFKREATYRGSC